MFPHTDFDFVPRTPSSRRWAARKVSDLRLGADEFARTLGCTDLARLMS
jgi:hypothetical protein